MNQVPLTKADKAIAYMAENGVSAYAAAKQFGISPAAVYDRQKWLASREFCPCCHQPLPKKETT
jgi:hypothetical protein